MDIRFQTGGPSAWKAEAVLTFVFEGEGPDEACHVLEQAAPWLGIAPAWRDFKGKKRELTTLYGPPAMDIPRVQAVGLGRREALTAVDLRYAVGGAVRLCREQGAADVGIDLASLGRVAPVLDRDLAALAREVVLAALLGLYRYDRWLSDRAELPADPARLFLLVDDEFAPDAVRDAVRLGEAEAAGLRLARDLANGPANVVTPTAFAETARAVAERGGMKFRALGPAELEAERMGAFLAVARGARQEPRLVVLEYIPEGTESEQPVVLVGKGVTFDSGGISIKPSAGMAEMKGDMSGAAAVLGVFEALAQLAPHRRPSRPVLGLMPCTENMPGGNATRPGDIVIARSGASIEITNTDAEGRLILADALDYGQDGREPALLVDIATLTGACVVALGKDAAGLFCDDDALAAALFETGKRLGERSWRLPIWDTSKEVMKSNVADMLNSGPREGGALHAAWFLKQFVKPGTPWAHLDIAATDNTESPINAKGASGFGVRTLLEMVW